MGRIRTIKPELFLDEELGVLTGDHLALFAGLLTLADKQGRLEDRPTRIKASLFPYRSVDVSVLLDDLERIGKVVRYDFDGGRYVAIWSFSKHQRPHPKEPDSLLPEPPSREKTRQAVEKHGGPGSIPSSPVGREGKGREGEWEPKKNLAPFPTGNTSATQLNAKTDSAATERPCEVPLRAVPLNPPVGSLEDGVRAVWRKRRGGEYLLQRHDMEASRALLDLSGGDVAEIVARWDRALAVPEGQHPYCTELAHLQRHWNRFIGPAKGAPAAGANPLKITRPAGGAP